uniref:Complement component C9 n=1 Tax=Callorhinchus milii TaxID=7868 RepID=V9KPT1_CALMI
MRKVPESMTSPVLLLVCLTLPFITGQLEDRDVDAVAPAMIDCELSAWSHWSACHPCLGVKYRSRSIVKLGQYHGRVCVDAMDEQRICGGAPTGDRGACGPPEVNCPNFQCENGHCLPHRLECNEDNDCGDFSDEDYCESVKPTCRTPRELSEMGRTAGTGVNILGLEPRASPFDNEWFNGQCKVARDGNRRTYFRIPWNVMSLNYQTQAGEALSSEHYTVASELIQTTIRETSFNLNAGFSVKTETGNILQAVPDFKFNISKSVEKILQHSESETNEYFSVEGKVQLGQFQMRSRSYRLSDEFVQALGDLMVEYEKGQYFRLLDDYGTHYTSHGTLGGVYRLVYVLNQKAMKDMSITKDIVKLCLGFTSKQTLSVSSLVSIDRHFDPSVCFPKTHINNKSNLTTRVIKDVVSFVKGGDLIFLSKLQRLLIENKESVDASLFSQWAGSLIESPVLVGQRSYPISSLVPLTMAEASVIRHNLDRAIQEYVAEYSTCKCAPCQNGGTPIQLNGECKCLCSQYFRGVGCHIKRKHYKGTGVDYTDGHWSCWSAWSPCREAQRSRTRGCVGIKGSGQPCSGSTTSTDHC